ncbi:MAG: transcription initiation factor IIB family protein, partial [Candidatus Lokiarchaeota archaeon]|nr:transcription initiation factor IIB family protein [Candidatus Lokiarchaeota archaeon]
PRYVAELGLNAEAEKTTVKILKTFTSNYSISGKDPKGLCAGALYFICKSYNKKISQKEIANLIGVTEVTLRSRYKEIIRKFSFKI